LRQNHLGTKLRNCTTFYSRVKNAVDPDAPPTTVFEQFGDKNSALVRFLDHASRVASSNGGKTTGNANVAQKRGWFDPKNFPEGTSTLAEANRVRGTHGGTITKMEKLQEAVNNGLDIYLIECAHENNMSMTGCKGENWTIAYKVDKKKRKCFNCRCKECNKESAHTQWNPVPELGVEPLTAKQIAIAQDSISNDESLSDVKKKLGVSEDELRRQIRRLEKEFGEDKLVKIEDMYNLNDFSISEEPFPFLSKSKR
jgi:hypothetical protein